MFSERGLLIEEHGAVEGVALDGLEACVADDAAEFLLSGAVAGAGRFDHVFLEHDGAYVVAAEVEAKLKNLEALRDPTGLHVFNVVEVEACDGEDLEVLDRGGFFPSAAAEGGVAGLEAPGDEGGESTGLLLQVADDFEVINALIECLADTEHHGGGGAHAELVSGAMDGDPVGGAAFETGYSFSHIVVEDLGAAAGNGIESGIAKARDGGSQIEFAVLGDGQDLRGAEAVQPDSWEALLDAGEESLEPVDFQVGVKAALHQHAGAAHLLGFGDLFVDFFKREDVPLIGAGNVLAFLGERAVESAERAVLGAEVGVVDVAIDDVSDHALGVQTAAHGVGLEAQPDEVRGVEIVEGLLACQRHKTSLQGTRGQRTREQATRERGTYLRLDFRKRNRPRCCTGSGRVRERFEAVEIPLKRTNQSQNARKSPLFDDCGIAEPDLAVLLLDNAKQSCGSGLWWSGGFGRRLSRGLLRWARDAEAHEEEAEAFAKRICQAHSDTCLNDSPSGAAAKAPRSSADPETS